MDMVERVARALCKRCRVVRACDCKGDLGGLVDDARSAIAAMQEPTRRMVKAAAKSMSPERRPTPDRVSCNVKHAIRYRAMIDAALTSSEKGGVIERTDIP